MRTAVVTGAGSGLGRAIAHELGRRGYAVRVTDVDAEAAAGVAAEIGRGAQAASLDVRDEAACRALAATVVAESGSLDLWVNNAGVLHTGLAWEQDGVTRGSMLAINASGTMNGTVAALEQMVPAGRGHVVNVISLAGIVAAPGEVAYSASKHAAMAFTLGTLFDLRRAGHAGIELSAVCPDGIWTPMLAGKLDDPDAAGSFSGQLLTPEAVAREVGKLTERPRPILVIPRWRGPLLRAFDLFPRLGLRLLPAVMWDARRRQRRYKRLIESAAGPEGASDFSKHADDAAEHAGLSAEDRLHRLVLGLQPDVVGFAVDPLDRRLLADQGDDDFAVTGVVARPHDDVVAFEDAGVLHAFAADLQDVVAVLAADHVGDLDVLLDVLLGEDRRPGGHLADQRQTASGANRPLRLVEEQLDRPRFGRVAAQQPDLLQVRQVRVHGRGRVQPHRFADLAHGRRVAGLGRVLADEVEDLLLPFGQVKINHRSSRLSLSPGANTFEHLFAGYRLNRMLARRQLAAPPNI
jgi:NAD(P)-dependent dehydrogenase (short-subunit alcohol dehydrogenase family)